MGHATHLEVAGLFRYFKPDLRPHIAQFIGKGYQDVRPLAVTGRELFEKGYAFLEMAFEESQNFIRSLRHRRSLLVLRDRSAARLLRRVDDWALVS